MGELLNIEQFVIKNSIKSNKKFKQNYGSLLSRFFFLAIFAHFVTKQRG
jgi:hypothetical protein